VPGELTVRAWRDVSWGGDAHDHFQVVSEIPEATKVNFELDKETGLLRVDRPLCSVAVGEPPPPSLAELRP
jgi:inorganic pyrophosphatase